MDIKLFSFQDKEVRTTLQGRDVWFAAQDVFRALGLRWTSVRDLNKRNIPSEWRHKGEGKTNGGLQEMLFINERAVYKLAFKANKNDQADAFTNWVVDLLVKIRKDGVRPFAAKSDNDHLLVDVQKQNSKAINSKMFMDGDVDAIKKHNTINCQVHTGKKPHDVKEIGKSFGLKSKQRSSAKEVLRHMKPELAASMSMTDQLVGESGLQTDVAANICKEYAVPLYQKLIEAGAKLRIQH